MASSVPFLRGEKFRIMYTSCNDCSCPMDITGTIGQKHTMPALGALRELSMDLQVFVNPHRQAVELLQNLPPDKRNTARLSSIEYRICAFAAFALLRFEALLPSSRRHHRSLESLSHRLCRSLQDDRDNTICYKLAKIVILVRFPTVCSLSITLLSFKVGAWSAGKRRRCWFSQSRQSSAELLELTVQGTCQKQVLVPS